MTKTLKERMSERDDRFVDYIERGLTRKEIADLEGIETDYAGKIRTRVARERLGITTPFNDTKSETMPVGLGAGSQKMRKRLASKLHDLDVIKKIEPRELTKRIGIPVRHQKIANGVNNTEAPYDWKLSQLERMAGVMGISLAQLLIVALEHELKSHGKPVGELVEGWLK